MAKSRGRARREHILERLQMQRQRVACVFLGAVSNWQIPVAARAVALCLNAIRYNTSAPCIFPGAAWHGEAP